MSSDDRATDDEDFEALLRQVALAPTAPVLLGRELLDGRLSITGRLGEGGMGLVFEALDRQRDETVALKTLTRVEPAAVYRLKNEFRQLADVAHENLVALYDLFSDQGLWCFTMERVDGVRFDRWVRPLDPAREGRENPAREGRENPAREGREQAVLDEARLRAALPQLLSGIEAIHAAGKLHRDLKPSNVLVTQEGRVVVLDFGLASDRELGGVGQTVVEDTLSGTPGYMAPEQSAGRGATEESDLYALGVMLFEALSGRLPFEGTSPEVLVAKQTSDAPRVRELASDAPADLAELCDALLARDPALRPAADAVRAVVGEPPGRRTAAPSPITTPARAPFVGRALELSRLERAFECARDGEVSLALVSGESGMGKTALVERFLLSAPGALVLSGRCYEREAVPFKAFDGVVDELSRHLKALPEREVVALLPRDIRALCALFPVLSRVGAVAAAKGRPIANVDALLVRRRAFSALKELFARIGDAQPLAVFVDDLQWGDDDSLHLLAELLGPPDPPALLLVGTYRSQEREASPFVRELLAAGGPAASVDHRLDIELGPLADADARALARELLGEGARAEAIALESAGAPFFLQQLARLDRDGTPAASVANLLQAQMRALPEPSRRLLFAVAVAGRPIPRSCALSAAQCDLGDARALLTAQLVRAVRGDGDEPGLMSYHDRVREGVTAALDAATLRECHAHLARALADVAPSDQLMLHLQGAGELDAARAQALLAAERAEAAHAFGEAAELYRRALDELSPDAAERVALLDRLGAVLSRSGRDSEAADVCLQAAAESSPELARDFQLRVANHLARAGRIDEWWPIAKALLDSVGILLPEVGPESVQAMREALADVEARGLGYALDDSRPLPPEVRDRLRTLAFVLSIVSAYYPCIGAYLAAKIIPDALDSGRASWVFRALTVRAHAHAIVEGWDGWDRVADLHVAAAELIPRISSAPGRQGATLSLRTQAVIERVWCIRYHELAEHADQLEHYIATEGLGAFWELHFPRAAASVGRCLAGQLASLQRELPSQLRAARDTGNQSLRLYLSLAEAMLEMMRDRPLAALAATALDVERSAGRRLGCFHYTHWYGRASGLLYAGELAQARRSGEAWLARFEGSGVEVVPLLAAGTVGVGSATFAAAAIGGDRDALERMRQLRDKPWYRDPTTDALCEAGIARAEGKLDACLQALARAEQALTPAAEGYRSPIRRRRGLLIGGDEGAALVREADAALAAQGVKNPARWSATLTAVLGMDD